MATRRFTAIVLICAILVPVPRTILAQRPQGSDSGIIYVDQNATPPNDGSSWADAYKDLYTALIVATSGDQVWVAEGTYKPGVLRSHSFTLKNGVEVYGGFPTGGGTFDARDPNTHPTILSCQRGAPGDNTNNCYHVVVASGTDSTAILDGFDITGGNANSTEEARFGGGIYNDGGSPILRHLSIYENEAVSGAGMYNIDGDPSLQDVIIRDNKASWGGGAIFNKNSELSLVDGFIAGNDADYGGGIYNDNSDIDLKNVKVLSNDAVYGGGLDNYDSSPTLVDVLFYYNDAIENGGGVYNDTSHPSLTDCSFRDNGAGKGGGVYNLNSNPVMTDTLFMENDATARGGGLYSKDSEPVLVGASFVRNTADLYGGGLNQVGGSLSLTNASFCANGANSGGGLYTTNSSQIHLTNAVFGGNKAYDGGAAVIYWYSTVDLVNVTLSSNQAANQGGGLWIGKSTSSLNNTILWGNTAATGPQIHNDEATVNVGYSLVQGSGGSGGWDVGLGTDDGGNIDADPLFALTPDPGPDAVWGTSDDVCGDVRLNPASPAIDAGDNDALPTDDSDLDGDGDVGENLPLDMALNPRRIDVADVPDTGNGVTPIVDMGTYERPPTPIYVDHTADGAGTGVSWADAFADLQDALMLARSGPSEIWVAQGTYVPGSTRDDTFQLVSDVTVYGGFPTGGGDGSFDTRDWQAYPTILSGEIGDPNETSDNIYHVTTAVDVRPTGILDGFTISGANGDMPPSILGRSSLDAATDAYSVCADEERQGGGMCIENGSPILRNLVFRDNYARWGGGVYMDHAQPSLESVAFAENLASDGGGLYAYYSDPVLTNLTFSRNDAESHGGGMYNESDGSPSLVNVVFEGNTAKVGGGLYNRYENSITVSNALFTGNHAWGSGGAIYVLRDGDLSLTNVTISGNSAGWYGGGIWVSLSTTTLSNTVLWSNEAPTGTQIYADQSTATASYCLIEGGCPEGATCDNTLTADPQFRREPDAGADGEWGTDDDDYGDLQVVRSSPVLDAGDNASVPADTHDLDNDGDTSERLPLDLAGEPRLKDIEKAPDTGNGVPPLVDMGAYEMQKDAYMVYLPVVLR